MQCRPTIEKSFFKYSIYRHSTGRNIQKSSTVNALLNRQRKPFFHDFPITIDNNFITQNSKSHFSQIKYFNIQRTHFLFEEILTKWE